MADKPISIRLTEEQINLLKLRAEEINEDVPEANVTVNSICRGSIDAYLSQTYRKTVEVNLVFPFCDKVGYYIDEIIEENNNEYFKEDEKVFYSASKIENIDKAFHDDVYSNRSDVEILEEAFNDIISVMEKEEYRIPNKTIKPWRKLLTRISEYKAFSEAINKVHNTRLNDDE